MRQFLHAALLCTAALAAAPMAVHAHDHNASNHGTHDHGSHDHSAHAHNHAHDDAAKEIAKGYFEDKQISDRPLSDWAGVWQSVYPYLLDGTLAPVMAEKAKSGDKSAEAYAAYYDAGYKTDAARIEITAEGRFTFRQSDGTSYGGDYISDGHEVLTYAKGNRGVRFIFKKVSGDQDAPAYIQFSDHRISPSLSDHFHLYWGDDRAALLAEVTHWPTYYPAGLSGPQIAAEMMAH